MSGCSPDVRLATGAHASPRQSIHPHLFRQARVRQIVRHTKSLALAQKQTGWARLHTEYLTRSDAEAEQLMQGVPE
jgi:hypothetical protein